MAITIVVGHYKSGVGKTKISVMISWELANFYNKKILFVDMDPKGNASVLIAKSMGISDLYTNGFNGFKSGTIKESIFEMNENFHLIPGHDTFKNLSAFLNNKFEHEYDRINYLNSLLEPLKSNYDYIFIDTPPTISDFSDNAIMAADYILMVLQAQEISLENVEIYIKYLQFLVDNYDANVQIVGLLPVLLRPGGRIDISTINRIKELFGEDMLMNSVIKHSDRLKLWDSTGITNTDKHDYNAHKVFIEVTEELQRKLRISEEVRKYG